MRRFSLRFSSRSATVVQWSELRELRVKLCRPVPKGRRKTLLEPRRPAHRDEVMESTAPAERRQAKRGIVDPQEGLFN